MIKQNLEKITAIHTTNKILEKNKPPTTQHNKNKNTINKITQHTKTHTKKQKKDNLHRNANQKHIPKQKKALNKHTQKTNTCKDEQTHVNIRTTYIYI